MSHEQDFNERQNRKKVKLKGCNFWLRSHNTTFTRGKFPSKKNEFSMIPAYVMAAEDMGFTEKFEPGQKF